MHCVDCGTELPDTAKFCLECGQDQRGVARAVGYKTCELVAEQVSKDYMFKHRTWRIVARVMGPEGQSVAGGTAELPVAVDGSTDGPWNLRLAKTGNEELWTTAVDQLVDELLRSGWEHVGREGTWYGHRFRRPAT